MTLDICTRNAISFHSKRTVAAYQARGKLYLRASLLSSVLLAALFYSLDSSHAQTCPPDINTTTNLSHTVTGPNATCNVTALGQLTTTGANSEGITVSGLGNTINVQAGGLVETQGANSDGIRFVSLGLGNAQTVQIDGTVRTRASGTSVFAGSHGIFVDRSDAQITVGADGVIDTQGATQASGILARGGGGLPVVQIIRNFGTISTDGISSYGIGLLNAGSGTTVLNDGSITIDGSPTSANTASDGIFFQGLFNGVNFGTTEITNDTNGAVTVNGRISDAIRIVTNGNGANDQNRITNNGQLFTLNTDATNSDSKGIRAQDWVTVINNGAIRTASGGVRNYGIHVEDNGTVTNTGTIDTFARDSQGIVGEGNAVFVNDGVITTNGATADGMSAEGLNGILTNNNLITTNGAGSAGLLANDGATITNNGVLRSTGAGGEGIRMARNSTVLNSASGVIDVTGANGIGIHSTIQRTTTPAGNNSVNNAGSITAATGIFLEYSNQIQFPGSTSDVTTTGSIISTQGANGVAVRFGNGPTNNGNDTLTIGLSDPNLIIGAMDMNNGDDTIILDRTNDNFAWRWTFDDFDPGAVIVDNQALCPATGDCLVITPKAGQVYLQSGETDFQRNCGIGCQDVTNEGMTIFLLDTNQINYLSDVSLDIVTSAHAAIDSRIEQAWKISLRKDRVIQPDEVVAFPDPDREMDFWFRPWIGMRHRMERDYLPETLHQWAGFLGGVNVRYDENWHFGVLGGLARSYVDDMSSNQQGSLKHQLIGAQAHYDNDKYFLDYSILFGKSQSDDMQPIKNNLVAGGIESDEDSPLLKGPFQSHSLRVGRRYQLHDDRWDLYLRPSAHAVYVRQTVEDIIYPSTTTASTVSIGEFTTQSIQARLEMASELIKTNRRGVFHSDLRMGLAMRGVVSGGGATINTVTDQVTIGAEKAGDYTYSVYTGLGIAWETSAHWTLNLDGEADYSFGYGDFTGRIRGAANFRF